MVVNYIRQMYFLLVNNPRMVGYAEFENKIHTLGLGCIFFLIKPKFITLPGIGIFAILRLFELIFLLHLP